MKGQITQILPETCILGASEIAQSHFGATPAIQNILQPNVMETACRPPNSNVCPRSPTKFESQHKKPSKPGCRPTALKDFSHENKAQQQRNAHKAIYATDRLSSSASLLIHLPIWRHCHPGSASAVPVEVEAEPALADSASCMAGPRPCPHLSGQENGTPGEWDPCSAAHLVTQETDQPSSLQSVLQVGKTPKAGWNN